MPNIRRSFALGLLALAACPDSTDLFALRRELERPNVTHRVVFRRGARLDSATLRTAPRP
jgi:hypothetical protein